MKPSQRFVSGATCPKCGEQDSLLIDSEDQSIECVDCGFTQTPEQRDEKNSAKSPSKVKAGDIIDITQLKD
ncbi:MAG: YheV family putative metal-binding protein [Kangiellaceae bacterium]|nr:YheV family putative metal-binding protein [Kangiellaceae bacterium]